MSVAQVRSGLLGLALALALPCDAGAQQVVSSLDQLRPLQNTNSNITVTDASGQQFRGTVADATPTHLSLRVRDATRTFAVADVRSVHVRREDSLLNGSLIGAAVAGGLSSLIFLDNECHDDPMCYAAVATYAGIGALAGLGIDAAIHRRVVVYTAPASAPPYTVRVAPLVARGRTGVRLTIGF